MRDLIKGRLARLGNRAKYIIQPAVNAERLKVHASRDVIYDFVCQAIMAIPVRKTVELYGIDLVIVCLVVIIEKSGGHHVEGFVNVVNAGGKNNEPASHGKH
jgi:hypothetical protein